MTEQTPTYRYRAFISYARADDDWARWLQRTLEGYRVPKELVGHSGRHGIVGPTLSPVFRDRVDLEAHGNLNQRLKDALDQSQFLIVVCSPASVESRWVDAELRYFSSIGRQDRILALVADGDPGSSDAQCCFPKALPRPEIGVLGPGPPSRPLAADPRQQGDGKHLAQLKIIAGLLGISLTDLTQREAVAERRRRRVTQVIATLMAILTLAALMAAGIAYWQRGIAEQEEQRANKNLDIAVGSLERVVFGISRSLRGTEGVSRSSVRTVLAAMIEEIDNTSRQTPDDMRIAELQLALLNELGEISAAQEDSETLTMIATRLDELESRYEASLVSEYARASSLLYQGKADVARGNLEDATKRFRLLEKEPPVVDDPDAVLDFQIAALVELGDIFTSSGKSEEAKVWFEKAARLLDGFAHGRVASAAHATSWRLDRNLQRLRQRGLLFERLGQIESTLERHSSALALLSQAVEISETLSTAFPSDTTTQLDLAFALSLHGQALIESGDAGGLSELGRAAERLHRIDQLSPGRVEILQPYADILEDLVSHSRSAGNEDKVLQHTREAIDAYRGLLSVQPDDSRRDRLVQLSVQVSRQLGSRGDDAMAARYLKAARLHLIDSAEPSARAVDYLRMRTLYGELAELRRHTGDLVGATHEAALAVDSARKAYALDDGLAEELSTSLRGHADLLAGSGSATEALEVLEMAEMFSPEKSRAANPSADEQIHDATRLSRKAFILFHNSDIDASIVMLKRALALLPDDPSHQVSQEKRLYWNDALGGFYLTKKDLPRAKDAFEAGLEASQHRIDSDHADAADLSVHPTLMGKIGWIEVQEGNREAAISWFAKAADATRYRARKYPSDASTSRALDLYGMALADLRERWPESRSQIPLIM